MEKTVILWGVRMLLLSVAHDDCCCAGRAVQLEYMALLGCDVNFARLRDRPICSRDSKGHLDIAGNVVVCSSRIMRAHRDGYAFQTWKQVMGPASDRKQTLVHTMHQRTLHVEHDSRRLNLAKGFSRKRSHVHQSLGAL